MNRRRFLKGLGVAGVGLSLPLTPISLWGLNPGFDGDFLLYVQVSGGWDVTSFCDPKPNVAGEPVINNWAKTSEVKAAGNLRYAPVADNSRFFAEHYRKTLIINGVNVCTNSHGVGCQYTHTGSNVSGTPHLGALYGYEKGQGMAMPVMVGSGRFVSGGLLAPTALGQQAAQLIDPNQVQAKTPTLYLPQDDLESIRALRRMQTENVEDSGRLLPRQRKQIQDFYAATFADTRGFDSFGQVHAALQQGAYKTDSHTGSIKFALTAFRSGLGVAADLTIGGFDTHENHDVRCAQKLAELTNAVGAAWHYAEQLDVADRLIVVLSSDFGRTPRYNAGKGKDHWPYGSTVIMKKNASWTNRVIGQSDGGHIGRRINPDTLVPDQVRGIDIEPKHVMHSLRQLLGIAGSATAAQFDLQVDKQFDFFQG